jgi:hypothetical protein
MKIYGYTLVSSECDILRTNSNGEREYGASSTSLFVDRLERNRAAIKDMKDLFSSYDFEGGEDFNGKTDADLEADLKSEQDICIQGSDSHYIVELFVHEVA